MEYRDSLAFFFARITPADLIDWLNDYITSPKNIWKDRYPVSGGWLEPEPIPGVDVLLRQYYSDLLPYRRLSVASAINMVKNPAVPDLAGLATIIASDYYTQQVDIPIHFHPHSTPHSAELPYPRLFAGQVCNLNFRLENHSAANNDRPFISVQVEYHDIDLPDDDEENPDPDQVKVFRFEQTCPVLKQLVVDLIEDLADTLPGVLNHPLNDKAEPESVRDRVLACEDEDILPVPPVKSQVESYATTESIPSASFYWTGLTLIIPDINPQMFAAWFTEEIVKPRSGQFDVAGKSATATLSLEEETFEEQLPNFGRSATVGMGGTLKIDKDNQYQKVRQDWLAQFRMIPLMTDRIELHLSFDSVIEMHIVQLIRAIAKRWPEARLEGCRDSIWSLVYADWNVHNDQLTKTYPATTLEGKPKRPGFHGLPDEVLMSRLAKAQKAEEIRARHPRKTWKEIAMEIKWDYGSSKESAIKLLQDACSRLKRASPEELRQLEEWKQKKEKKEKM